MKRISKAIYFLFFFLSSLLGLAQVSTYTFNETVVSYNPLISGTTVAYSAPWDNNPVGAAHLANIGFNFTFDGVVQSQCFISPNGFITFGTQATATTYLPLSVATPLTGGGAISALGMDLISNTDNVVYATIGTAPNRTFVVQWSNAVRKAGTGNFNFQIRLNETSNTIQLSYGVCAPDGAAAVNTQVGIRGESSVFLQGNVKNRLQNGVNVNSTWSTKTIEGTANSSTVRTSLTEYPNDGLLYTFAPSLPCTTPTANASGLIIGATNVTATSFVGNSFTAASPAPTNYLILRSTINTPPTALNIPNRTYFALGNVIAANYTVVGNTNATIFNQTGLAPNTTYYYWVIPYNAGCLGGPFYRLTGMLSASNTTCVAAPTGLVASTVEGNSFTASWAPVTGATDYLIDVSTTNTFTSILPGYNNLSTAGATSIPVTGLNSVTTYYFRVRAVGSSCFFYSATRTVTTVCGSFPIPYFQSFDTTPVNTTPQCFTITDENSDATIWQVRNTQSASNPNSIHLNTNAAIDSDDWFFTPGLQLNSGVTYRLRFKYNTESAGLFSENLRIRLGSGASVSDMSLTLLNLPNTVNTVYQTALVDFTIFLDGVYFLGFQGYSLNSQSKIIIDDISVIVSPTCFEPTNLKVTAIGSNTASISWDESVPPPSDGYQYYVSTSSNMPNATDTPTGSVGAGVTSVNLSGLSSATLYYFWVRGNCSPTDQSVWSLVQSFSTDCATPALIPVFGGTLCGGGSTTLQATPAPGATIEWFSNAAGTILVGTGDNFTTPNLFATTTFYAQSVASGGLITVGPSSPITQGGALGSDNNPRIINFNVATVTDLQSIDIFPIASGQSGTITIKNTFNALVGSASYTTVVAGGSTPQTIPLNIQLLPGSYTFAFDTLPAAGLVVNVDSATYPYSSSVATITGNDFDNIFYMYAYNWKFSNICRSLLTPVVATITPAPPISLSQSSASICFGDTTSVVSLTGFPAYDTLVWSPATAIIGDENTGYTFNPTTTTNYTLTAAQTSGSMCVSVLNFDVTVRPEPPAIGVVPATATLCEGQTQILNAALSSSTPVVILEEGFNAPTNNWIVTQTSTGGDVTASEWTLRNSPYTYTSPYWVANNVFSSNDSSQFYLANSDAQGPPASNRTVTYLESPTFNLTGYTSASMSFWHFLRYIAGNRARVEASI
ncbi:MAG: fibronectin type III domain-containing protein, partial [Flavobacterium macrobrachii]